MAATTVPAALRQLPVIQELVFCCFCAGDLAVYDAAFNTPEN